MTQLALLIKVTDNISLRTIHLEDQPDLHALMHRIYPPAYAHYWQDQGTWYVNTLYGVENLKKELEDDNSQYYFIILHDSQSKQKQVVGIFKVIQNYPYPPKPSYKAYKVHRIYLDPATQGQGIGRRLMKYAVHAAKKSQHELLWLDAMDTHVQAQAFYASLGFEKTELQQLDFELLHPEHRPMWYLHTFL